MGKISRIKNNSIFFAGVVASLFSASTVAGLMVVTPGDLGSVNDLNTWYLTNYRSTPGFTSTTVAEISNTNARSGNGSVEMSLTDGSGKADFEYIWGYQPSRNLGSLNSLSMDWYRSSTSTNPSAQAPALRLYYDADGDAATTGDIGLLVWEYIYQGSGNPMTDTWVSSETVSDNFWMRTFAPGVTIDIYGNTLNDWATASPFTDGGGDVSDTLTSQSALLGVNFGIGSGWNGAFEGFVDNIGFTFDGEEAMSFNFEASSSVTSIPEPSALILLGLGLVGIRLARRNR